MFNRLIARRNLLGSIVLKETYLKSSLISKIHRHYTNSSAYDGDGKTTVTVLNKDSHNLHLIDTYSERGFRIVNNLFIYGSILIFPTQVYSWNVSRGEDINMDSLAIFDLIVPKIKILVVGYGTSGETYDPTIPVKLKEKGISCEILPTPHAVTTYNYLVHDAVHVAGAFIPVKSGVKANLHDRLGLHNFSDELESSTDIRASETREDPIRRRKLVQEVWNRDKKKD